MNIDVEDPEPADALIGSKVKILPKDVDSSLETGFTLR